MRKLFYLRENGSAIYTDYTAEGVEEILKDNESLQAKSLLADMLIEGVYNLSAALTEVINSLPEMSKDSTGQKKHSCPGNVGGHTIGIMYGELITEYDVDQGRSIDEMVPFKFCKECGDENAKR